MTFLDAERGSIAWEYDGEADTVYIGFGKPKPALGVDVGEGVGLTLIGVGKRMEEYIRRNP